MQSRHLCSDLIVVEWQPSNQCEQTTSAVVDEISARGACLLLDHPIAAETPVRLTHGNRGLRGKVRRCEQHDGAGYLLHVDFVSGDQWSAGQLQLKHLLDPATLPPCMQPSCSTHGVCQHTDVCAAAKAAASGGKVRAVAREVAAVCRNLDAALLASCFHKLYGPDRSEELLNEFIEEYRVARRSPPVC